MKGTSFLSVLAALRDLRGIPFAATVEAAIPGEAGEALRYGSVLASGWYPVAWYRALHAAAVSVSGDANFPRELGRGSVRRDVTGIYRVLFQVLSIDVVMRQSPRFFRMCFEPASVEMQQMDKGLVHTRYHCVGFDRNLWLEQHGCAEELLKLAGAQLTHVKSLAGGGEGDDFLVLECKWR